MNVQCYCIQAYGRNLHWSNSFPQRREHTVELTVIWRSDRCMTRRVSPHVWTQSQTSVTVWAPLADPSLSRGTQTHGGFLCHSTALENTDSNGIRWWRWSSLIFNVRLCKLFLACWQLQTVNTWSDDKKNRNRFVLMIVQVKSFYTVLLDATLG